MDFVRKPVANSADAIFDTTEFSVAMACGISVALCEWWLHLGFESKTAQLIQYHELL